MPNAFVKKTAEESDFVRGTFYHHLKLGVRIHFERVSQSPEGKFAVTCNGNLLCFTETDLMAEAKKIFAELWRLDQEQRKQRTLEE